MKSGSKFFTLHSSLYTCANGRTNPHSANFSKPPMVWMYSLARSTMSLYPFHDVLIRDAVAYRRALSRLGNARMRFGIALAAPDLHGFISDGTRCGYLMTRADALQVAPLESPDWRGTQNVLLALP